MDAWRKEDTRGLVVNFLDRYRSRLSVVRIDAIGVGHNFGLHLRDHRFPVELINVGMGCDSKPQLRENNPARRFVNLKAQFYQELADALERNQVEGLTDEATIGQLAGLLYEIDSSGRMKIESKEQARARGVPSPDRAEALMLALAKPPIKYEYHSIRDLPHLHQTSQDIGSRGSFWVPDHDDDDDHRVRTRSAWDAWAPGGLARDLRRGRGGW